MKKVKQDFPQYKKRDMLLSYFVGAAVGITAWEISDIIMKLLRSVLIR